MNEIVKVCYLSKDTDIDVIKKRHLYYENQLEKKSDWEFYILEHGKRVSRKIASRTYDKGDFVVFQRSSYYIDIFVVSDFLPDNNLIIRLEEYKEPDKPRKKVGF